MTLNEMVKATQGNGGGIGADKIVNALRNMSGEVKKEFASMPMTVHQAMEIIGNRWDMFIHRLNRSTTAISWIASKFLWLADKVEYSLDVVTEALGGAENAVKILGVALGAAGLVGAVYLLSAAFTALTSPVFLIIAALAALFLVGEDVNSWLSGSPSLLGDMIGPVTEYTNAINSLTVSLTNMKDMAVWAWNALNSLADFFNSSQDTVKEWGDKLGTTKFGPWLKEKIGSFDVSKTWSDVLSGASKYSSDTGSLLPSYQSLSSPQSSPLSGPKVDVHIGNISVPAGTSEEQAQFLRDSAQSTFNDVGWNALGNTLNFNTGG